MTHPTLFDLHEVTDRRVRPGRPISPEETVKKELRDAWDAFGPCFHSKKLDGCRLQLHFDNGRVWLFSRNALDWTWRFPDVSEALQQLQVKEAIFDSEVLAVEPSTGHILPSSVMARTSWPHHRCLLFDLLFVDGEEVLNRPLAERLKTLADAAPKGTQRVLQVAEERWVESWEQLEALHSSAIAEGLEGSIIKAGHSIYQPGVRSPFRVKVKDADTLELAIVGFDPSTKGKQHYISSLMVAVYNPLTRCYESVGRAFRGHMNDAQWRALCGLAEQYVESEQPTNVVAIDAPGLWVQPALVLEVDAYGRRPSQKYIAGLADYGQGHELASVRASAKGLREDRDPLSVTTIDQLMAIRFAPGYAESDPQQLEEVPDGQLSLF